MTNRRITPGQCFKLYLSTSAKRQVDQRNSTMDAYIYDNIQYSIENIRSSLESMKGTMLHVMAKRMNEKDIVAMAKHWGWVRKIISLFPW